MKGLFDIGRWMDLFRNFDKYLAGFGMTLRVSIVGLFVAILLGIVFGLMQSGKIKPLQWIARCYVEVFQNTPLVIQIFFYYSCLPFIIGGRVPKFTLGVLGVGIYHGAYICEVIRTGIESTPKGQLEAAASQGFSYIQSMRYIILPQTLKVIMPPMANQALNLVKNTSALAMVAGLDLMYYADSWSSSSGGHYTQGYLACAVLYFIICFPLAKLAAKLEERAKEGPKLSRRRQKAELEVAQ
jgi:putative glutamine transport system permease protein